jgi:hypothetical protein
VRYKTIRTLVRTDDSLAPPLTTLTQAQRLFARYRCAPQPSWWEINLSYLFQFTVRHSRAAILVLLLLANVLLLEGMGVTVVAAQESLPGDTLYPTKIALEETQTAVSLSNADKFQTQLRSSRNRVGEIAALTVIEHLGEIPNTAAAFERKLDQVSNTLDKIVKENNPLATALGQKAVDDLSYCTAVLTVLSETAPEPVKSSLTHAVKASEVLRSIVVEKLNEKPVLPPSRIVTPTPLPLKLSTKTPPAQLPTVKIPPARANTPIPPAQVNTPMPTPTAEAKKTPPGQAKKTPLGKAPE